MGPLDSPEEVEGIALETLFLQEITALNSALDLGCQVHYWRTSNGREVDFVLYGPNMPTQKIPPFLCGIVEQHPKDASLASDVGSGRRFARELRAAGG